ncbi:hypothetical protein GQ457_07G038470 [Hibiscus cannabinus]
MAKWKPSLCNADCNVTLALILVLANSYSLGGKIESKFCLQLPLLRLRSPHSVAWLLNLDQNYDPRSYHESSRNLAAAQHQKIAVANLLQLSTKN